MGGIGHNQGPTMEPGARWRRFAWGKARAQLLPKLPLEVVRLRVRRAKDLGLDYKSYASIRAASGHDVLALLFSSNALRLLRGAPQLADDRSATLSAVKGAERWALVHPPLAPGAVVQANPDALDWASRAPAPHQSWADTAADLKSVLRAHRTPGDRVVVIGDTVSEREWLAAGRLAGYIAADKYFGAPPHELR